MYLDDITSLNEHLERLQQVFDRLKEQGIRKDPEKNTQVKAWLRPTNHKYSSSKDFTEVTDKFHDHLYILRSHKQSFEVQYMMTTAKLNANKPAVGFSPAYSIYESCKLASASDSGQRNNEACHQGSGVDLWGNCSCH